MSSKEALTKALKRASNRNVLTVFISGFFMISILLLSVLQVVSMFIKIEWIIEYYNYLLLFTAFMLISYIINLVLLIRKDPSRTYVEIELIDIIESISKVKLDQITHYLELITLMSYKVGAIKKDSKKKKEDYDKVIAREWLKKTNEKAPANHMNGYIQLSKELYDILKESKNKNPKPQPDIGLEKLFLTEKDYFKQKNTISILKLVSSWLLNNMLILANYAALLLVVSGFVTTIKGKMPTDTYFYAASSFLLIFSTIVNDYNSRMKKISEWMEE